MLEFAAGDVEDLRTQDRPFGGGLRPAGRRSRPVVWILRGGGCRQEPGRVHGGAARVGGQFGVDIVPVPHSPPFLGDVDEYPEQPGTERGSAFESVDALEHGDPGFLYDVLRDFGAGHVPSRYAQHHRCVQVDQFGECRLVRARKASTRHCSCEVSISVIRSSSVIEAFRKRGRVRRPDAIQHY